MYTLYYSPGACSLAVHTVLNELGVPFQAKKSTGAQGKTKEFLEANPRGAVPVLVDDGQAIREGGAILVYLLDRHKSPLLPREGKERASALEWLMFCNATLHPAYGKAFFAKGIEDKAVRDAINKPIFEGINKLWQDVEQRLNQSPYLAGNDITAADILLSVIANWKGYFDNAPITIGPKTKALIAKVSQRPSFQKALSAEQVEYKAAA